MAILQRMMIAFLSAATLAAGAVNAASTTNFSDQWWNEAESGWGASVLQQADALFIDLFVYGADNKPTWFTAAALNQNGATLGHTLFAGDLYQTNGPYHSGSFNASAVTYVKVGTLTFDAATTNDATLTYSVDGRRVVKNVTRQFWRYENLTGNYGGFWHLECSPGATFNEAFTLTVTHNADNSVDMFLESIPPIGYFLFHGTYSQSGHMGQIVAHLQAPDVGTVTFSEIERSRSGFIGRVSGFANGCQLANGPIAAFLQ